MQSSSNVNYSGLGHLLCNSKMSQRCMPLLVWKANVVHMCVSGFYIGLLIC